MGVGVKGRSGAEHSGKDPRAWPAGEGLLDSRPGRLVTGEADVWVGVARTKTEMRGSPSVGFGWVVASLQSLSETRMPQTDLEQVNWRPWPSIQHLILALF